MMVDDFDEFNPDPVDSTYGYSKKESFEFKPQKQRTVDHLAYGDADSSRSLNNNLLSKTPKKQKYSYGHDFGDSSFLRCQRNSDEIESQATQVLQRAKCTPETIKKAKKKALRFADLHSFADEIDAEESKKLRDRLADEALANWNSMSLFTGTGVEVDGTVSSMCLIRLNELCASAEEYLLAMYREFIMFSKSVDELKQSDEKWKNMGFEDENNRRILVQSMHSLRDTTQLLLDQEAELSSMFCNKPCSVDSPSYFCHSLVFICGIATGLAFSYVIRRF